jgi:predicted nucleotidyltransferase
MICRTDANPNAIVGGRGVLMPQFGLQESTLQKIREVLADHAQVEAAILYGSRARGNYKNGSDIDLTLVGDRGLTMRVLYRIMDEMDDLLLPYTIDLSLHGDIEDAGLIAHIQRVGIPFYQRRPDRG